MTVKELKNLLSKMPDNAIIMCASDSEHNSVSPLLEINNGRIGTSYCFEDPEYNYCDGEDFECFDYKANKGKDYIIFTPTL